MRSGRILIALVIAAIGGLFYFCRTEVNPVTGEKQRVAMTTEQETALGLQTAPQMAAELGGLHPDETLQNYVEQLGERIVGQSAARGSKYQYDFHLLADPETVNAFALPGGQVFITAALLRRLQDEAQLAGVLGHEIVHVLRKHHLKAIQKGAQSSLAGDAMSMALKDRAGPARDKLIAFGTEMYSRGLDKGDELEADRLGIVIAARAGYDAYGLPSVLQTLQAMSAQDSAIALMFKTHPAPGERLDALSEKMQPVLDAYSAQPQLADRFVRQIKK